ncbi:Sodium/hydrogen exchanger [Seminavis robusta]|uniref:Sodium/hydrogen exchanger 8 n=1 Tax=Seminavis robusta TaxID=568900 RepID=A0A9N8D6T6_9STRA|nr:Sodium/hydrogen exchanger [Seminavis robusta]|eukprot:Sro3_g002500.1 Sodium/hydrogen exchanger (843) ;mRNA; r:178327-180938
MLNPEAADIALDGLTNATASFARMEGSSGRKDTSFYCFVFASLVSLVLVLSNELRQRKRLSVFLPEAGMIILVGMAVSVFVETTVLEEQALMDRQDLGPSSSSAAWATNLLSFHSDAFFMLLLPPILFNSGYQLKRELFYRHIGPIVLFAALGTILSALSVALTLSGIQTLGGFWGGFNPSLLELLAFGSLIAATDTVSTMSILHAKKVDPRLFYVVFGESALNDAVALVLFKTFVDFLGQDITEFSSRSELVFRLYKDFAFQAICSPLLGSIFSIAAAVIFQRRDFQGNHSVELTLYLLISYIPYMVAEYLELSGIVTIFFCGLAARRYTTPHLSDQTNQNANVIFKTAAYLSETCIFLEMGLSVFSLSTTQWEWGFIQWAFLATLLGRAISIYPISIAWNLALSKRVFVPVVADDQPPPAVGNFDGEEDEDISWCDNLSRSSFGTHHNISIGLGSTGTAPRPSSYYYKSTRTTPLSRKDLEISSNMMHVLWFAGIRGSVAYACVRDLPGDNTDEFVAATTVIILVTTFVMGGLTPVVLAYLNVPMNVNEDEYLQEWQRQRMQTSTTLQESSYGTRLTVDQRGIEESLFGALLVVSVPSKTSSSESDESPPPPPPPLQVDWLPQRQQALSPSYQHQGPTAGPFPTDHIVIPTMNEYPSPQRRHHHCLGRSVPDLSDHVLPHGGRTMYSSRFFGTSSMISDLSNPVFDDDSSCEGCSHPAAKRPRTVVAEDPRHHLQGSSSPDSDPPEATPPLSRGSIHRKTPCSTNDERRRMTCIQTPLLGGPSCGIGTYTTWLGEEMRPQFSQQTVVCSRKNDSVQSHWDTKPHRGTLEDFGSVRFRPDS